MRLIKFIPFLYAALHVSGVNTHHQKLVILSLQLLVLIELELIYESVPTQQRERMVIDPVNQYQKLYLQLYELLMMGVSNRNM